jgi:Ca2+-binding EF-hand superfamily protein
MRVVGNYEVKPERVQGESPAPALTLKYRPSSGVHSQFALDPPAESETLKVAGNRVVLTLDGLLVEFLVRSPSLRVFEQTCDVLRREVASLPGEKRITDDDAFPVFLRDHAQLIDGNADGQLTEAELESYLEDLLPARFAAESVRVVFRSSSTIAGLFGYLDQDQDGELSHPELSRLANSLAALDQNADQKLSAEEIPLIVRIVMERETAPPPYLIAEQRNAGPPWFYRLDKNQDGTLSPSEFPGTRELFEQLDQNRDQILTLEEALAADAKAQRTSRAQENEP